MLYIFRNLKDNATFDDFRKEHFEQFGFDFYEYTEDENIPKGIIAEQNNEWVYYSKIYNGIVMYCDDIELSEDRELY